MIYLTIVVFSLVIIVIGGDLHVLTSTFFFYFTVPLPELEFIAENIPFSGIDYLGP